MAPVRSLSVIGLLAVLSLTGCDRKAGDLNALDAQLADNGSLAGQIVVDPKLAGSQALAKLPVLTGEAGKALNDAVKIAGGTLLATPAVGVGAAKVSDAEIAAVEAAEKKPGGNVFCREKLTYGAQWASRLPEAFPLFPGAKLVEAAGADKEGCTLRAATFVTPVPRQSVMDFYYTQARRAGFDVEHQSMGGTPVLGGSRKSDGSALFLRFSEVAGGQTSVDLIADQGR